MTNPTFPRHSWAAAVANRREGIHPAASVERILRAKLALRPGLENVDLASEEIREAIRTEVDEKLRFSPDGSTFVAVGPDKRIWSGDEDEILKKLANSLAVRIAAATAEEAPVELSSIDTVRENLKRAGVYRYG